MSQTPLILTPAAVRGIMNNNLNLVTDALYAILLGAAYQYDLLDAAYSDVSAQELDPLVQTDYVRQAITGQAVINAGTNNKGGAFDHDIINFGASVTLTAKYLAILKGTAASPQATDLLVGFADLNYGPLAAISAITRATAAQVTQAGHGLTTGDLMCFWGSDMEEINRQVAAVTVIDANNYTVPINSSNFRNAGTLGYAFKINDTSTIQSSANAFTVDLAATGLFTVGA